MCEKRRKQQFLQAIAADNDEAVEDAALLLLPDDEAWLLAMAYADADDNVANDVDQRWWAVRALAVCGTAACLPALTQRLRDDDAGVRAASLLALAHLHARLPAGTLDSALPSMANCLADDEGYVRQAAADALALCGDDAVGTLAAVLAGEHEGARTRATAALRKIATTRAAALLYQHLNDPNHLVRLYAYEALDEMGFLENQLLIL